MEKRFEISILLDLYGELLTEKQYDIMDLYFNNDLSLAEISEITKTSRQAVHDAIKRCDKVLFGYEDKLQLMKKNIEIKNTKETIINKLDNIKLDVENEKILQQIENIKNDIIENI